MTIYDLTEAIKRHRRLLVVGFGLPVFVMLLGLGFGRSAVVLRRDKTRRIPVHSPESVSA